MKILQAALKVRLVDLQQRAFIAENMKHRCAVFDDNPHHDLRYTVRSILSELREESSPAVGQRPECSMASDDQRDNPLSALATSQSTASGSPCSGSNTGLPSMSLYRTRFNAVYHRLMGCQGIVNTAGPADSASRSTLFGHDVRRFGEKCRLEFARGNRRPTGAVPCHRLTEGRKRLFADVVFDPLGIDTRGLRCHAERHQEGLDRFMTQPALAGEPLPEFGQEHAAHWFCTTRPSAIRRRSAFATVGCATPRRAAIST